MLVARKARGCTVGWELCRRGGAHEAEYAIFAGSLALVVALIGSAQSAFAGAAIANGSGIYMGVNDEGHHNFSTGILGLPSNSSYLGIAATFPDGSVQDATSPGCLCEGWGVAGSGVSGYANVSADGGAINLTVDSFTTADPVATPFGALPSKATSSVHLTSLDDLTVTHAYAPSVSPSLFEGVVTITNTGAAQIDDILYRRVMDWDVPPTEFSEFVTHGGLPATNVLSMQNDGFSSANPLSPSGSIGVCPANVNFVDCGVYDHGTVIDFTFGDLAAGASKSFSIFYGASPTEAAAFAALAAVGAEVFSLGQQSGDPATGTPLTYIFAFKGVGGRPITTPEPSTLVLLAVGAAGAYWRRRRARVS